MTATNQACLVDTNVLLRFADSTDPLHDFAHRAIVSTRQTNDLQVTSQNLIESWNVMTRPQKWNGFGQTVAEADDHLALIERLFHRLSDPPDTYQHWRKLVVSHGVSGVQVHDARLVAIMLAHGIAQILTFNVQDFARYADLGIEVIDPRTL